VAAEFRKLGSKAFSFSTGHESYSTRNRRVRRRVNSFCETNLRRDQVYRKAVSMEKLSSHREALLTTAAVARWLGVSTRTICLWAECRELPAIKIGRQWRFREGELTSWLQSPDAAKVTISTKVAPAGAQT